MNSRTVFLKFILTLSIIVLAANLRAQTAGVTYNYPSAGSTDVSSKTTIGVRYSESLKFSSISSAAFSVIGISSGKHSGKVILALDNRTVIFTPDKFFTAGEKVQVTVSSLKTHTGKSTAIYSFHFIISKIKLLPFGFGIIPRNPSFSGINSGDELASVKVIGNDTIYDDFPAIFATSSESAAAGNFYMTSFKLSNNDSGSYLLKVDNNGNPLFARSIRGAVGLNRFAQDFQPQPSGLYTYYDNDPWKSKFYGLDKNFKLVDSFEAGNGYVTDNHELLFLHGGGYALIARTDVLVDMSHIISGGDSETVVEVGMLQEFDAAKNLIFEWRTKDHIGLTDPTYENLVSPFIDLTHCNSIEPDGDSAYLFSMRNLDEVTKINRETGNIIWRWGGKHNQFRCINESLSFSHQHAVKKLPDGNIIMFDNGTFHNTPAPFSRAVEYKLDEKKMIAEKVWEYHHDPEVYGSLMGYVQQLANGNRVISWGTCDSVAVTEITPDGRTAMEIKFDPGVYTYRAYKYTDEEVQAMQTNSAVAMNSSAPVLSIERIAPNPFSSSCSISFALAGRSPVDISLYDALGRKVRTLFSGEVEAGNYTRILGAAGLASGSYALRMVTPEKTVTTMIVLQK